MRKWEYLTEVFDANFGMPDSFNLDTYGARGWELVFCTILPNGDHRCIFKRPIEEAE